MKKRYLILLCALILFSGCGIRPDVQPRETDPVETTVDTLPPTEEMTDPTAQSEALQGNDALATIKDWLDEDCSYRISCEYMNLAYNGMSQEIVRDGAKDGSFHFLNTSRRWDHWAEYDQSQKVEYYYRYEDGRLACYMRFDDGTPERTVMSAEAETEMMRSSFLLISSGALLPRYLEGFGSLGENTETGTCGYAFSLPVEQLLETDTYLAVFVRNAFTLYGSEYDPATDLSILCHLEVEKDTLRPLKLTYDFDAIKPYVMSEGALSGEYALGEDFMVMTYEFDYAIAETIAVPEEFLP